MADPILPTEPNTEKEVPEKISDQAILMLKLREMAQISRQADTVPIFRDAAIGHGGTGVNEAIENGFENFLTEQSEISSKKDRRFNNLCVVDYEFPYAVPNVLLSHDEESSSMLKLTTLQLSLLVPRLRIFKTVFDLNLKEELHVELPFDDVANKLDIERIYSSGTGRGSGCGLKSFEWKSLGKNQANLSQFSANLKIYLQNIEEMQQIRNSVRLENGRIINVSVLDLLYQKPDLRSGVNEGSNIYDSKYFGIKVEVGWNLDNLNQNVLQVFNAESQKYGQNPDKILAAVLKQKTIFYLTLSSHELNINENGSIDLSIDYIASAEIDASDNITANVLKLDNENEVKLQQALQQQRDIDRQLNSLKVSTGKSDEAYSQLAAPKQSKNEYNQWDDKFDRYSKIKYGTPGTVLSQDEAGNLAQYQSLKKQKENADKALEDLRKNLKVEMRSSIINGLLRRSLINTLCITNKDLETLTNLRSNLADTVDVVDKIRQDFDTIKLNLKIVPSNTLDMNAMDSLKGVNEGGSPNITKQLQNGFGAGSSSNGQPTKLCPDNSTQISFFFFGDLLDIILEKIFNDDQGKFVDFTKKTTRILLGPITYYDFGSIEDNNLIIRTKGTKDQSGELVAVYRGKQTIVNMADIPISVREFSRWFANNIINKARETYSFWDFAKDIIDDLIISAIAAETYKFAPRQQVRINILPFSVPQVENNEELFREVLTSEATKSFRFNLDPNRNFNGKTLSPFLNSDIKAPKQNYILFYGINQPPLERIAEEQRDLQQKIYHVFIGEERGLIKKVGFSRDDNPRQRASNIQQSNPEKQQNGLIIREKYSAKIQMFGNFLFLPGQQIFVHPTYPGLKGRNVRENIFRKLGLGGYYRVIETNSKIASGEFTTDITTKWDAFGDGTLNLGDQLQGQPVNKETLSHEDNINEQSIANPVISAKLVAE